jgi:MFS family permease
VTGRRSRSFVAYIALLALAALDAAGYAILAPVVPAIGDETGAGPAVAGALVATFGVGQLVGYPLAGGVVARRGAAAALAGGLALLALGSVGFVAGDGLTLYFAARLLQGVGAGAMWMGVVFAVLERYRGDAYARLTAVLAAYSVGGIAGAALGGVGGIRAPFAIHLTLVLGAGALVLLLGSPAERPRFDSDRAALRTRAFVLAAAGILLVAIGYGVVDGPLPLHLATELSQREIAALYVGAAIVLGAAASSAGRVAPRAALLVGAAAATVGIALAGATSSVAPWIVALGLAALGFGAGEAGALGLLLERIGADRMVLAMVVWSQVWAVGYLVGPAVGGAVAEAFGFGAIGVVPLVCAVVVGVAATRRRVTAPAPHPRATRG